ncbi:MAG: helix-turn-helix transcriptional regulator [Candidatus Roizmanbacteria bacterium]
MVNVLCKKVGRRICHHRKKKGFSQEELALMAYVDRTYLARIEEGKTNPSIRILSKIAKYLQIKTYLLLIDI